MTLALLPLADRARFFRFADAVLLAQEHARVAWLIQARPQTDPHGAAVPPW